MVTDNNMYTRRFGLLPPPNEELFKQKVKSDIDRMVNELTPDELKLITFAPRIISEIAWIFTDKVLKYCAEHKIEAVKKLSRAVKYVKDEYYRFMAKDLDYKHIQNVKDEAKRFMDEECSWNYTTLYYSVDAELKKKYGAIEDEEMRVNAFIVLVQIYFLELVNKRGDEILKKKLGMREHIRDPFMDKLKTAMQAYAGNYSINYSNNMQLCVKILENSLNEIEFIVR